MTDAIVIFFAEYVYILVILIAGISFLDLPKSEKKDMFLLGIIALPCIYILSRVAAYFYFDPRPFVVGHFTPLIPHIPDNGFPSDHALLTSALSSVVFYFNKKIDVILWLLTILICAARVLAGVHHTIDMVGAILIAIIATFFIQKMIIHYTK